METGSSSHDLLAQRALPAGTVALVGVPFDEFSSFMRGPALAPHRIREVLHSGSSNWCAENEHDLSAEPRFQDVGDLELAEGLRALTQIEEAVASILERGASVLVLGGDHSITYPVVRAYAARHVGLNILQLDAHPDLYDEFECNRYSHACPFARIMEECRVARLVQIGVRTINPHLRAQAERFGVEMITMQRRELENSLRFEGPVYLSLDMDVLDPAFAPGVSHHEPGGLATRDVLGLIQRLPGRLVGADIVEYNPLRDPLGITAMVAGKLLKELVARLLESSSQSN
jgi:agmatinase